MKFKFLNSLNIFSIFIVAGLLFNNACSRSQDATSTSSIQFSIPAHMQGSTNGLSAQTTPPAETDLEHVVVNISGSGFNTIAQTWSKKGSGIGSDNSAPVFSFDVLQGEGRLIQAIAVYKNADNGMDFYYGETIATLYNDNELITVTLGAVGSSTGMEGSIEGRYVTGTSASPVYPTGTLTTVFTPPGRSPVIIAQSPMTDGWFSAFVLSGQKLDYLMDGESITNGAKQVSDFDTVGENILVTKIPQYYQFNGAAYELRPAKAQIRGFFGPVASGVNFKVCYKTNATALVADLIGFCTASDGTNCNASANLKYDAVIDTNPTATTGPTAPFVENGTYVRVAGGVKSYQVSTICSAASSNIWTIPSGDIHRFLMDPTTSSPSFSKEIQGALNTPTMKGSCSTNCSFASRMLPGITALTYDFYAMTKDAIDFLSYDGHSGINCNKMFPSLDGNNAVIIGTVTKVKSLSVSSNYTVNTTTTASIAPGAEVTALNGDANAKVVVCPRRSAAGAEPFLPGAEYYGN